MKLVHVGLVAVTAALVGPLGRDGLRVGVDADQIGLVGVDAPDVDAVWVGAADLEPADGEERDPGARAREVGRRARALVQPVMAAACAAGPVGVRGLHLVVLQTLTAACRGTSTGSWARDGADWAAGFLQGLELSTRLPDRTMRLQPDDGPPVELTVPRVCCVLDVTLSCHACPTCPKRSPQQRRAAALDYLADMDDEDFAARVGRGRIGPARRS